MRALITGVAELSLVAVLASGQNVFYATTGEGGVPSSLYTVNSSTGAATLIGSTGFTGIASLAFSPGGTLYAIAGDKSPTHQLITINTSSGAGVLVGATGITSSVTDIAFRSDGVLFAMTGKGSGTLFTVNTVTGAATLIGSAPQASGGGLAFNSSNTLYVANGNTLQTVNQANGGRTDAATFTFTNGADSLLGMKFHPVSGALYAMSRGLNPTPVFLVTVNPSTGANTSVGSTGLRLVSLAISGGNSAIPATPIPGSVWLSLTGMIALAGWMYWRRSTRVEA